MKTRNDNCLESIHCPICESLEPFRIEVTGIVTVHDDGTDDDLRDIEWEDNASCQCVACNYIAQVKDFHHDRSDVQNTDQESRRE